MLKSLLLFTLAVTKAQDVEGIYPVSGDGAGVITVYGDNLDSITDIRFRSELIQGNNGFLALLLLHTDTNSAGAKLTIPAPLLFFSFIFWLTSLSINVETYVCFILTRLLT